MASSSYQSPESKKQEFRRYLEKSGAIESLTTAIVGLYEESDRPVESTDYIRQCLTSNGPSSSSGTLTSGGVATTNNNNGLIAENEKLKKENGKLKKEIQELTKTVDTLRSNLKHSRDEARGARDEVRKMKTKGVSS